MTSTVTTIAGVAALLFVWIRFARGDGGASVRFARYAAAAITAFVAFGKVFSGQFLAWLLVSVVLVLGRRRTAAIALLVGACGLTRVWFHEALHGFNADIRPAYSSGWCWHATWQSSASWRHSSRRPPSRGSLR